MNEEHEYTGSARCCRECKNRYSREWMAAHPQDRSQYERRNRYKKRVIIDRFKLDNGCADCGYNQLPHVLSFDHVRGEKRFTIGQSFGYSLENLLAEIEKCEVVCHNCHAIRTFNRNQHGRIHDANEFLEEKL